MAIYEKSRYKGSYLFLDDSEGLKEDIMYLSPFRENIVNPELGDFRITFEEGMRIDILAKEYYGSEELDWVIMDANPKYLTPFDIKPGDILVIPRPERIMSE